MRSVSLLSKQQDSTAWQNHQIASIAKAVQDLVDESGAVFNRGVEPLFPGSYLCNQIMVLRSEGQSDVPSYPLQDLCLNTTYGALSSRAEIPVDAYILIDGDCSSVESTVYLTESIQRNIEGVKTLVVFSRTCLEHLQSEFDAREFEIQLLLPEWNNPEQLISIYRHAAHCIFIDNHRAVDAALSGCQLTLIATTEFCCGLNTSALWQYLSNYPDCLLSGDLSAKNGMRDGTFKIIRNNIGDLRKVINDSPDRLFDDWLDEYRLTLEDDDLVIPIDGAQWNPISNKVIMARRKFRRKAQKFIEDPRRFCADSNIPMLKRMAKLIPLREVA